MPMLSTMNDVVKQLERLNAQRLLIRAAKQGKITAVRCEMEECLCPKELGGREYFEAATPALPDWMPTNDHFPILKCHGGPASVENCRLAHRLCNRVDYAKQVGKPYAKDLARVEAARLNALQRSA